MIEPAPAPEGGARRRRWLRTAFRALLLVALFAAVILAVSSFVPGAGQRLSRASPAWLAAAIGLELAGCGCYVLLFHAVFARPPHRIPRRRSVQIGLGELGAFAIVPTGIGGPVLRFWALRAGMMPLRTVFVRSVAHAGLLNAPYVLAAMVLGAGVSLHLLPGRAPVLTALAPAALVVALCALVLAAALLGRRGGSRMQSALAVLPDGARDFAACARRPSAWVGSLGWWAGDCGALWAAFHASGSAPALSVLILAYMLGQLGNALPLPGGVGGVEPLMLGIFVASGVDIGLAAAAIVCYRAVALGIQGLTGAVGFATLAPELRAARRASAPPT